VTIICSDKTGTLTKNEMTVTKLWCCEKIIDVSGAGYAPKGSFSVDGKSASIKDLELAFCIGSLCNNAKLQEEESRYSILGDPTEGSLLVLTKKANQDFRGFKAVKELPFDSERKMMSSIYDNPRTKKREAYVKGAPDLLLAKCDRIWINGKVRKISSSDRKAILAHNHLFGTSALRVLGLAYRPLEDRDKDAYTISAVENKLIFVALVGMIDPPRDEVPEAIRKCKEAGIRVMVITGDHPDTAKAVAQKIGLYEDQDIVLVGADIEKMSDKELDLAIGKIRIVARALPIQKLRIVEALQRKGEIVAMTGDGVNDAPALKKADIGIAMGITGTDVAKEVSEGMLVDDNFATIVNAVEEGRRIYDKIIKSTRYLLSCNAGEVVLVFSAIMMRLPLPLIPLQILLMNLVTDGLPALALTAEEGDEGAMRKPPRNPKERPLDRKMLILIVVFGLSMGLGAMLLFRHYYLDTGNLAYAQTIAFTSLVMIEMFAVLASRSFKPFGDLNPFTNRWIVLAVLSSITIQLAVIYLAPLQSIFGTVALSWQDWKNLLLFSIAGALVMEACKFFVSDGNHRSKAA
ncbi:MAG TPA: HAD-IC family P-type ATPase, partial [Candidatus Nanoarchaeia archaeon]|nr:HAD-IC family P-type ATPase [Candidatus Nanoarchaeia archaeon]